MTAKELIDIWHSDPKNKHLGAKKSAIKFAEYYHQEKVKSTLAPVSLDEQSEATVCHLCNGLGKGNWEGDSQEIECDVCEGTGKL